MSEGQEKKKRRKRRQTAILKELEELPVESPQFQELVSLLEVMEKKGQHVNIRICPSCKSARVRPISSGQDPLGHMNIVPKKYECLECGWRGRLELLATSKPRDYRALSGI